MPGIETDAKVRVFKHQPRISHGLNIRAVVGVDDGQQLMPLRYRPQVSEIARQSLQSDAFKPGTHLVSLDRRHDGNYYYPGACAM